MTNNFAEEIARTKAFTSQSKIIEFGCGTGLVGLRFASSVSQIVMIDNSPAMLSKLKEKISLTNTNNVIIIEGELNDYNGNEVDQIMGFMTLHHIEDTKGLLDSAHRLLKQGGSLIIGDLVAEDGSFHPDEKVPHNGFDVDKLTSLMVKQGFEIIKSSVYGSVAKGGKHYPLFFIIASRI